MKYYVLKLTSIVFILSSLAACENKSRERSKDTVYYGLKGPVKSVSHTFDYSNSKNNTSKYAEGGLELDFNTDGRLTRTLHQSIDLDDPESKTRDFHANYIYDDKGKLVKQNSIVSSDTTQSLLYLYRKGAQLPYAALMLGEYDSQMHLYKHDERGNLTEATSVNKNFDLQSQYTAKYNSSNQPLEHKNSFGADYYSLVSFEYNEQGFVHSKTESVNTDKSVLTYKYLKLDSYDNWITRKVFSDEKEGYVIEKRDIIYY